MRVNLNDPGHRHLECRCAAVGLNAPAVAWLPSPLHGAIAAVCAANMVEVVNSTPEPDGTSRTYWLRVPPATRTAREGIAWTFGLTEAEYHPEKQT